MNSDVIKRLITNLDDLELKHYASQYYDPAKAHEYYMKNRQLQGHSTSGLTDEGKEVWKSTKSNIDSQKKSEIDAYKEQEEINIKNLRDKAETTRESISNKLKQLNEILSSKFKNDSKELTDEIKAINENSSLSKEQKAAKREKIYIKRDKLSSDKKEESSKNSTDAKSERTKVATDLKTAIQSQREIYKKNKASLESSFGNILQNEYDKIKTEYQSTKKT